MKKICSLLILCLVLLLSCSQERKTNIGREKEDAYNSKSETIPSLVSASIFPDKPTAATPLIVNYSGRGGSDELIQYEFRWFVNGELVQEGELPSLAPGKYRRDSAVYVEVIPFNSRARGNPFTTSEIAIANHPPVIHSVSLTPDDATVGTVLTADATGSDPDEDQVTYLYQWRVNEKVVVEKSGANQLNTSKFKKKDMVYAAVWASDGDVEGEVAASNIVVLINNAPQITSSPSTNLANGNYTYQVAAQDPDKDRMTYSLESAPPGMTINASTGFIQWTVPKEVPERQEIPIKIKVDDGDGGTVYQEYSLFLEPK